MGASPARRRTGPRAAAAAAAAAAGAADAARLLGLPASGPPGGGRRPPRLRVTVVRVQPAGGPGVPGRWSLDTAALDVASAWRLHELVDAAEASGSPAGPPGGPVTPARGRPGYEVTVARGYGHWTVRTVDGAAPAPLAALVEHVIAPPPGAPDAA